MSDGSLNFDTQIDTSGFKEGTNKLNKLGKSAVDGVSNTLKAVGASVAAVSASLVGLGTEAVKLGSTYEDSLNKVATIADTSVKSISELSAEVKKLSSEVGVSADQLNEAVYQAISAGADTAKAVDLVAVGTKAAKAGFTDTTTAVDALTSVINAYGMATEDADDIANKFLITQNLGKTSFGEMSSYIGAVIPTAAAAGMSVDELLASISSLTANSIKTPQAMTTLNSALSNIIKPSSEAAKLAEELGINFSASELKAVGWANFLNEIAEATDGDTDKMAQLFGSVEALKAMLILTGEGADEFANALNEMGTNTTALDEAYETMADSLSAQMDKMKVAAENLGTSFYDSIADPLKELAADGTDYINKLADAFSKGGLEEVSSKIGELLVDALGTVGQYAPQVAQSAADVIRAFIKGMSDNKGEMMNTVRQLLDIIIGMLRDTVPMFVTTAVEIVGELATAILDDADEIVEAGVDIVTALIDGITNALPTLIPAAIKAVFTIANELMDPENLNKIFNAASEMVEALIDGLLSTESLEAITSAAVNLPIWIVNAFNTVLDNILKLGVTVVEKIAEGIIGADWEQIFSGAVKAFEDAGARLKDAMVNGFRNRQGLTVEDLFPTNEEAIRALAEGDMNAYLDATADAWGNLPTPTWLENDKSYLEGQHLYEMGTMTYGSALLTNAALSDPEKIVESGEETVQAVEMSAEEIKKAFDKWYKEEEFLVAKGEISEDAFKRSLLAKLQSSAYYNTSEYSSYWSKVSDITDTAANNLKKSWADVEARLGAGLIDEKQALEEKKALIQKYCPEYSEEWSDYYSDVYSMQKKAEDEQLDNTKKSLKSQYDTVKDKLSDIASEYKTKYKEITSNTENYSKKLLTLGDTVSVKSTTDSKTGVTTKTVTLGNISERLDKIKKYHKNLMELKKKGADPALLKEIIGLDGDDAAFLAEQLINDPNFDEYNKIYSELATETAKMATEFYADDVKQLNSSTFDDVIAVYNGLPEEFRTIGSDSWKAFTSSFMVSDGDLTDSIKAFSDTFESGFKDSLDSMKVKLDYSDVFGSTETAYDAGVADAQAYSSGFNSNVGINSIAMTTEASYQAVGTSGSKASGNAVLNATINLTTNLDGQKIAESTTKYQTMATAQKGG